MTRRTEQGRLAREGLACYSQLMSLNHQKLTQAQYRERYSGLEMLFDCTRSVRVCAETMRVSEERVSMLLHRMGYRFQPGRWIKR